MYEVANGLYKAISSGIPTTQFHREILSSSPSILCFRSHFNVYFGPHPLLILSFRPNFIRPSELIG